MVTTGNMVKLDHELINKWAEREGMREGERGPVIRTADQLIISWSNEHERETLQTGLLAAWPEDPGAPGETVLNEFEKSLGTYDEALLPNVKERMITLLYAEETLGDLIEETRTKLPLWVTQARGKQRRRRQAVRQSEDWGAGLVGRGGGASPQDRGAAVRRSDRPASIRGTAAIALPATARRGTRRRRLLILAHIGHLHSTFLTQESVLTLQVS